MTQRPDAAAEDPSSQLNPPDWRKAYDDNGVDRTLIRSALRRTPTECLQLLDEMYELAESVRVHKPVR